MKEIAAIIIGQCHTILRFGLEHIEVLVPTGWFRSPTDLKAAECPGE